jgi:hypothetical protein
MMMLSGTKRPYFAVGRGVCARGGSAWPLLWAGCCLPSQLAIAAYRTLYRPKAESREMAAKCPYLPTARLRRLSAEPKFIAHRPPRRVS